MARLPGGVALVSAGPKWSGFRGGARLETRSAYLAGGPLERSANRFFDEYSVSMWSSMRYRPMPRDSPACSFNRSGHFGLAEARRRRFRGVGFASRRNRVTAKDDSG